jgi:hypothetical protein
MDEATSHAARRSVVDKCLTEVSLMAKELCPAAQVEATTERYEDEDGHVRIYPPLQLKPETDYRSRGENCRAVYRHSARNGCLPLHGRLRAGQVMLSGF